MESKQWPRENERALAVKPDAIETFTLAGMGGDTGLIAARARIGGFEQLHFFMGCGVEDTRA
jgi:hypothetical protein